MPRPVRRNRNRDSVVCAAGIYCSWPLYRLYPPTILAGYFSKSLASMAPRPGWDGYSGHPGWPGLAMEWQDICHSCVDFRFRLRSCDSCSFILRPSVCSFGASIMLGNCKAIFSYFISPVLGGEGGCPPQWGGVCVRLIDVFAVAATKTCRRTSVVAAPRRSLGGWVAGGGWGMGDGHPPSWPARTTCVIISQFTTRFSFSALCRAAKSQKADFQFNFCQTIFTFFVPRFRSLSDHPPPLAFFAALSIAIEFIHLFIPFVLPAGPPLASMSISGACQISAQPFSHSHRTTIPARTRGLHGGRSDWGR